jgi:membrane-bound serine protease (ClpP class)
MGTVLAIFTTFGTIAAQASASPMTEMLSSGPMRFVLLMVFLISLYIALHAPGHGLAETVAIVCLAVLLGVPLLAGMAPWWTAVAVIVGLILIAVEVFLVPGFGLPGLSGLILFLGGMIFLFASPDPSAMQWHSLQNAMLVVTSSLICSGIVCVGLQRYLPQVPYLKRIILSTKHETPPSPEQTWPFVGSTGTAVTDLRPGGSVEFAHGHDRRIAAVVSDGRYLPAGSKVVVHEISGNRILVRMKEQERV